MTIDLRYVFLFIFGTFSTVTVLLAVTYYQNTSIATIAPVMTFWSFAALGAIMEQKWKYTLNFKFNKKT